MKLSQYIGIGVTVAFCALTLYIVSDSVSHAQERSRNTHVSPEWAKRSEESWRLFFEGRALLRKGEYKQAEQILRKAQALDPTGRGSLDFELAETLSLQGRHQEALAAFEKGLNGGLGGQEYQLRYGRLLERAGRSREAVAAYRRSFAMLDRGSGFPFQLRGDESDAEVIVLAEVARGIYQKRSGDLAGAAATLRSVVSRHPDLVLARKHLAQTLEEAGRVEEAKQERRAVEALKDKTSGR